MIRLLHTADLQLGKRFGRFPAEIASALRAARLETLARIAGLAREREVDAVLVAGDVFDDLAIADETLRRFLVALEGFRGPWLLLPGNHDPAIPGSPWQRLVRLGVPDNVVIAHTPEPIVLGGALDRAPDRAPGRATVLPAPLVRRRDAADLTAWFDDAPTPAEHHRIGLAHGSVRELLPSASEAANPVALDRDHRARLDYLALGDWHGCLRITDRTWYAGTHEPDRFRSNDPGQVLLVTIDAPGAPPAVEPIDVARYQWAEHEITVLPDDTAPFADLLDNPRLADQVLTLTLRGTLDLDTHHRLLDAVADLAARVTHLEYDESALTVAPSDSDLEAMDAAGFVHAAVEALRERAGGEDGDTARRALVLLHALQRQRAEG